MRMAEQLMNHMAGLHLLGVKCSEWAPRRQRAQPRLRPAAAAEGAALQPQVAAKLTAAAVSAAVREVLHHAGPVRPPIGMLPVGYQLPRAAWHFGMPRPPQWHLQPPAAPLWQQGPVQRAGSGTTATGMAEAAAAGAAAPAAMAEAQVPGPPQQQMGSPCTPVAPLGEPAAASSPAAAAAAFLAELGAPSSPATPPTAPSQHGTPQSSGAAQDQHGQPSPAVGQQQQQQPAGDKLVFPPLRGDLSLVRQLVPGSQRQHRGIVYLVADWENSYVAESQLPPALLEQYWEQQGGRPADLPPLPGAAKRSKKAAGKRPAAAQAARATAAAAAVSRTPACGRQRTRQATRLAAAAMAGSSQQ